MNRGDQYVQQGKFPEAVIEYKNAARAAPDDVSTHWKLAQAALRIKEFKTAFAELQWVVTLDPSHENAKETLGQIYLAIGKVQEAERIAQDLVTRYPDRSAGYALKGSLAAREGDVAVAIAQFQQAVERDDQMAETMLTIGHLYLLQQNPAQALSWYDRALKAKPDSIDAHVARGNYYFAAGQSKKGEQDFQKAVELSKDSEDSRLAIVVHHLTQGRPRYAEQELIAMADAMKSLKARMLLVELKLELGETAEAKRLMATILPEEEHDLSMTYLQGRMALAEQRREEARTFLQDVVKRDAGMAAGHLYLGVLNLMEGQRSQGEEQLLEAVKLDPANSKAHLALAELYLSENSFAKAEQEALEVFRRNPAHIQAAIVYADSFLLRDEWARAEAVYSAIMNQLPQSPIGPTKMAVLKRRQGFTAQAAELFAEAVARSPNDDGLLSEYLLALVAAGHKDKASRILKAYLGKAPQDSVRWEVAGRFHTAVRHVAEAEEAMKKATELAPDNPRPMYQLAQWYLSRNQLAPAEVALRKVLDRDDRHEAAHTSLGLALAAQGRTQEANDHYRRALELRSSNYVAANNLAASLVDQEAGLDEALRYGQLALEAAPSLPAIQDTVGWIYFKKGSLEEAYPLLTRAASELSDNPMVRYHHAMVLAQRGDKALAVVELEAALSLSKNFPGAEEAATMLASMKE
ncbi:MAG: tetratricopeptide repeat protein [Nitrospiraceae bacterium]